MKPIERVERHYGGPLPLIKRYNPSNYEMCRIEGLKRNEVGAKICMMNENGLDNLKDSQLGAGNDSRGYEGRNCA